MSISSSSLAIDRDRISDLHESNICHILSRLPTKHAIQTTVLSKAWKHKWTSLYNVDFVIHDFNMKDKALKKSFYNTIDRIIAVSKQLKSFRLEYGSVHGLHWKINGLQKLVSAMERSNLESFQVRYNRSPGNYVVYEVNFLSSTSLRHLKLEHWKSNLNVSKTNCAPNLTSLYLSGVRIRNGNSNLANSTSVTFTFPVLKTFEARNIKFSYMKCVEIYAPALIKFFVEPREFSGINLHSFVLVAPMLTTFGYNGYLPKVITLKYTSSIFSASFLNDYDDNHLVIHSTNIMSRAGELLNEFTNLKELSVSPYIAKELVFGSPLHRHDKLKKLIFTKLKIGQQLLELLMALPTLEFLSVDVSCMRFYGNYEETRLVVPSCIVSHLETVEFIGFVDSKPCYTLAKFLLKNGKMLKKIVIYGEDQEMEINKLRIFFSTLPQLYRSDVRIMIGPLMISLFD